MNGDRHKPWLWVGVVVSAVLITWAWVGYEAVTHELLLSQLPLCS